MYLEFTVRRDNVHQSQQLMVREGSDDESVHFLQRIVTESFPPNSRPPLRPSQFGGWETSSRDLEPHVLANPLTGLASGKYVQIV